MKKSIYITFALLAVYSTILACDNSNASHAIKVEPQQEGVVEECSVLQSENARVTIIIPQEVQ